MRSLFFLALVLTAPVLAARAQAPVGEEGIARPGGAYTTLALANAALCARMCAEDALCMAWTHRADGQCELKATAPAPIREAGARSGLSTRAPAFARQAVPAEPPPQPAGRVETLAAEPPPAEPAPGPETLALLGGPLEGDLRPRLSRRR